MYINKTLESVPCLRGVTHSLYYSSTCTDHKDKLHVVNAILIQYLYNL